MMLITNSFYSVSQAVGYLKGKSAIWVARMTGRHRNFVNQNFWAGGRRLDFCYFVRHEAAKEMRDGPSESVCRDRLQTTQKLRWLKAIVVSVLGKVTAEDCGRWGSERRTQVNH